MKARWLTLLTVILCCSACGAPSLRHKKEVNKLLAEGNFAAAEQKLEKSQSKQYTQRDALLFYLDTAVVLHDEYKAQESDMRFAWAQQRIEELFTQSVTAHVGQYLINDLTVPYTPAPYEQALTYYYRAMNFLDQGKLSGALVEANKAVFYLDNLRHSSRGGWRDDPFVQYFASLVFESAGKRDDARIARTRAFNAYQALTGQTEGSPFPSPGPLPGPQWGEVVLVHANGIIPLKVSQTIQVAWRDIFIWANTLQEGQTVDPSLENAIMAGVWGNSITLSYPGLQPQAYLIKSSEAVTEDGKVYPTQLVGDLAAAAQADLRDNMPTVLVRMALRAIAKRVAAVQTRHAVEQAADSQSTGELAGMVVSLVGALTEKADTRQWFTLPAQMRLTRFYVPAGQRNITLRFKDGFGNIVGEHTFENVPVLPGGRIYLHYRTAK